VDGFGFSFGVSNDRCSICRLSPILTRFSGTSMISCSEQNYMNLPAELIRPVGRHLPSTSSHKWETYRRRRFGRFSRRRATSILRSVRTERATQKIGQSAIGPPGWLEKGLSASLLVRHVSQRIRSSLAPSIQTLLKPTACLPLMRRCTSLDAIRETSLVDSETIVAGARQVISQLS
jgi:hypothetical protein